MTKGLVKIACNHANCVCSDCGKSLQFVSKTNLSKVAEAKERVIEESKKLLKRRNNDPDCEYYCDLQIAMNDLDAAEKR